MLAIVYFIRCMRIRRREGSYLGCEQIRHWQYDSYTMQNKFGHSWPFCGGGTIMVREVRKKDGGEKGLGRRRLL